MKRFLLTAVVALAPLSLIAQTPAQNDTVKNAENQFKTLKAVGITSIKNQANSGTCWSYSGVGFLESELMRMGKGEYDLSDMFVVNHSYKDKAEKYVRMHGKLNFGQGGSFYDVIYVLKHYGIVPEEVMTGLCYGTDKNQHSEMESLAKACIDAIIKNPNGKLSPAWKTAYNAVIDSYLGTTPDKFTYKSKSYTPSSFAQTLGLNADDYVSLTSFSHHPFYSQFQLEIEDNWRWANSYNLPIDEFMKVMENAVNTGYSIAWGADVSELGFTRDGIAVLTDLKTIETKGSDQARWLGLSANDKKAEGMKMIRRANCPEITPTQAYRQECFDNYTLTDDHGMLIYGLAENQLGKKFFMVKNSWGDAGSYKGIWYASWNYVAGRTMNIVIHKNAIPKDIAKKLGIK
ncbi:aminopeptidase C [Porphyromonas pogonae]|uniref:aminopeptidase C n=1 Tax=Porphyromonas pogonae TaxID=867595 RepID=UPI002E7A8AEC|nr:C1 family peptidase [Porphyromonas pogonae]